METTNVVETVLEKVADAVLVCAVRIVVKVIVSSFVKVPTIDVVVTPAVFVTNVVNSVLLYVTVKELGDVSVSLTETV